MKRLFFILFVLIFAGTAHGQGSAVRDSLAYRLDIPVDSALVGRSVFDLMPSKAKGAGADVTVHQSQAILDGMKEHIGKNPSRTLSGYRVRIYFDNRQNARSASEAAMNKFIAANPEISAYRSYQNPFFKVTVGDFRTRSEAMELLLRIRNDFPTAFVVKEKINYPSAGPAGLPADPDSDSATH